MNRRARAILLAAFGRSAHGEPLYMAAADVPDMQAAGQSTYENGE